jgi:NhaP-type Na+/H+ or K+/H+ antiporter
MVGVGVLLGWGLFRLSKRLERWMSPTMAMLVPYSIAIVIIYGSLLTYLRLVIPYPEAE